jgi:hypothetical protein
MRRLIIVNPGIEFKGSAFNSMTAEGDIIPTKVDYPCINGRQTFAEFNAMNGGKLLLLSEEDYLQKYLEPYYQSLQRDWVTTTEEDYDEKFGCLQPLRFHSIGGFDFYYMGECVVGDLYDLYAWDRENNIYWTALRSIHLTLPEIEVQLRAISIPL